jgi:hypothetical protein
LYDMMQVHTSEHGESERRSVGARASLGRTARGNSKVGASQKFANPTKTPHDTLYLSLFPRVDENGCSSRKRRKRKCCVQGTKRNHRA